MPTKKDVVQKGGGDPAESLDDGIGDAAGSIDDFLTKRCGPARGAGRGASKPGPPPWHPAPWHLRCPADKAAASAASPAKKPDRKPDEKPAAKPPAPPRIYRPSGRYYAVRTGHAAPNVGVRSAIFFHWADARQFVEGAFARVASKHDAEFDAFDTLLEAEAYLREGEEIAASKVVEEHRSAGKKRPRSTSSSGGYAKKNCAKKKSGPKSEEEKWETMYSRMAAYAKKNGSIDIPEPTGAEEDKDDPATRGAASLIAWRKRQQQVAATLSDEKIEKLRAIGVPVAPWDEMRDRLAAHKAAKGTLDVSEEDDPDLLAWTKVQKTALARHFRGKEAKHLSPARVEKLKALGYGQSRPGSLRASAVVDVAAAEAKWNSSLGELKSYMERNGESASFSWKREGLSPSDRALKYWVIDQRKEYKLLRKGEPSQLTAARMQRLSEIGFDFQPVSDQISWEERMDGLRAFVEEHGRLPNTKDPKFGLFVTRLRSMYQNRELGKPNSLTDDRVVCASRRLHVRSLFVFRTSEFIVIPPAFR
ncbi:hypothetical protein ACHAWF_002253 [Thalassiosira exigua]